jgi:hypothetical protein
MQYALFLVSIVTILIGIALRRQFSLDNSDGR